MSFHYRFAPVAGVLVAIAISAATADEVTTKQRKVAETNLGTAGLKKGVIVESDNLILCSALPEARGKVVSGALEKVYKTGRKGLQFDAKEEAWKGKLAVYFFPTRLEYNQFLRLVAGEKPGTPYAIGIRSDEPYIVGGGDVGEKAKDTEIVAELGPVIGAALLLSKTGPSTPVPGWVKNGFGRAVTLRSEGPNGKRFVDYKIEAKKTILSGTKPVTVADIWGSERPDGDVLATNLMDYMAFGPGAANFSKFLTSLKPDENDNAPSITTALESAGWKWEALDAAWKKWVTAGMPEPKTTPAK